MKTFYAVLANSLTASNINTSAWFAVTFWVYLQTQSVIATSIMAGVYTITVAAMGSFLGSLVDCYKSNPLRTLFLANIAMSKAYCQLSSSYEEDSLAVAYSA